MYLPNCCDLACVLRSLVPQFVVHFVPFDYEEPVRFNAS